MKVFTRALVSGNTILGLVLAALSAATFYFEPWMLETLGLNGAFYTQGLSLLPPGLAFIYSIYGSFRPIVITKREITLSVADENGHRKPTSTKGARERFTELVETDELELRFNRADVLSYLSEFTYSGGGSIDENSMRMVGYILKPRDGRGEKECPSPEIIEHSDSRAQLLHTLLPYEFPFWRRLGLAWGSDYKFKSTASWMNCFAVEKDYYGIIAVCPIAELTIKITVPNMEWRKDRFRILRIRTEFDIDVVDSAISQEHIVKVKNLRPGEMIRVAWDSLD